MSALEMIQTQSIRMQQKQGQILRMEQANLLEMSEDEFKKLIANIEQSSLFKRLYYKEKLVHYQRFFMTDISSGFYRLEEERIVDGSSLDVESLLLNKEYIIRQVKKLGLEKFKRYFLFPEPGITLEEIVRENALDISEVKEINKLVDEFSILSEFYHPSNITSDVISYSKVASVEKDEEGFIIGYYSPYLARGRYSIDHERFEELKAADAFTEAEAKEARQLFKKLELINSRKDTLTKILQNIIEKQATYLETGDSGSLLPFNQKDLAKNIELAPSSVSRTIRGKSIETPWGEEIPLKNFFPRPKKFIKEFIKQLIETDKGLTSDESIRAKLREKFGVAISRRSVANLRKELKYPASRKEKLSPWRK